MVPQKSIFKNPGNHSVIVRQQLDPHHNLPHKRPFCQLHVLSVGLLREISAFLPLQAQPVVGRVPGRLDGVLQVRPVRLTELQVGEFRVESLIIFMRCFLFAGGRPGPPLSIITIGGRYVKCRFLPVMQRLHTRYPAYARNLRPLQTKEIHAGKVVDHRQSA